LGKWSQRGLIQSRQVLQENLQGRIGTFVGFLRLLSDVKEKVRKEDCSREIKNSGTNPLVENIEIIQKPETECTFKQIMLLIFY
jgi:hypothetical protein